MAKVNFQHAKCHDLSEFILICRFILLSTVVMLNIFVETLIHLFVFTVTSDQFNASFLNKSIHFLKPFKE